MATTIGTSALRYTKPGSPDLLPSCRLNVAVKESSWWLTTPRITPEGCIGSPIQWTQGTPWWLSWSSTKFPLIRNGKRSWCCRLFAAIPLEEKRSSRNASSTKFRRIKGVKILRLPPFHSQFSAIELF